MVVVLPLTGQLLQSQLAPVLVHLLRRLIANPVPVMLIVMDMIRLVPIARQGRNCWQAMCPTWKFLVVELPIELLLHLYAIRSDVWKFQVQRHTGSSNFTTTRLQRRLLQLWIHLRGNHHFKLE